MSFIRRLEGTASHVFYRLTKEPVHSVLFTPKDNVDAKIQEILKFEFSDSNPRITKKTVRHIKKFVESRIVPLTSDAVKKNPLQHLVNENDFFLQCIEDGNYEQVKSLLDYHLEPIPEQLIPQRQTNRTWKVFGSCRPDPLLYAIFKNRMDIAISLLHSNRYALNETYCFPLSTVWINATQVSKREDCSIEISPLTVALMQPTPIEDTRHKVKTLLKLGAKKEILSFKHPEDNEYREDNYKQTLFVRQLESHRHSFDTFLKKCF